MTCQPRGRTALNGFRTPLVALLGRFGTRYNAYPLHYLQHYPLHDFCMPSILYVILGSVLCGLFLADSWPLICRSHWPIWRVMSPRVDGSSHVQFRGLNGYLMHEPLHCKHFMQRFMQRIANRLHTKLIACESIEIWAWGAL